MEKPSTKRYPPELKDRAVRMFRPARAGPARQDGDDPRVARQLGVGDESLRNWVRQEEIDAGKRPGTDDRGAGRAETPAQGDFELRRANDILQAAASFFGAELDRRHKK